MDEMMDIVETGEQFLNAATNYDLNDFHGFVTAILRTFGFPGIYDGSSSMAEIMDWIVSLFGPLANVYLLLANYPDTATFINIVNKLLALISH